MNLTDRVVVVTGASSGIGAATARAFAREGAHAVLVARTRADLESLADEIEASGGRASAFPADLSDPETVQGVASSIRAAVGVPDVVVNNAGAGRFLAIEETSPSEARQMMAVPYFAAFDVTRAFIPDMLERDAGHVVNVTSAAAIVPWPGSTAYATARWAMRGFSAALRADLHDTNVGVTLVVAAEVASTYWEHNPGSRERVPGIARLFPMLTPADVADAIVDGVRTRRRTVLIPFRFRVVVALHRLAPRSIEWLVTRTGWRRTADSSTSSPADTDQ